MLRKRVILVLLLILGAIMVLSFLNRQIPRVPLDSEPGYVIALKYIGQQGSGVKALLSLQRWLRDVRLPMKIVEPFIVKSVLGAFKSSTAQELKFSDLFDLTHFNEVSRSEAVAEIVPWDTYVTQAPHNAVLIQLIKYADRTALVPSPKVLWYVEEGGKPCWDGGDVNFQKFLNSHKEFCFVRVVAVHHNKSESAANLSSEEICRSVLSGLDPSSLTLVFTHWRGSWNAFDPLLPPPASCQFYSNRFNYYFGRNETAQLKKKLRDSPRLLRDIRNYQKMFLTKAESLPYVAVMIRTEHVLVKNYRISLQNKTLNPSPHAQLQQCLDKAVTKAHSVMKELRTQNVFVAADVGIYGSHSWNRTMQKMKSSMKKMDIVLRSIKNTVSRLYRKQWTFDEWEKTFSLATGGLDDSGYMAALQRGVASKASCLVLLGGGSFQKLALDSYLNRKMSCIHYVC